MIALELKKAVILFVFLIPSLLYLATPYFLEYDSYYFLDFVCHPNTPYFHHSNIEEYAGYILFGLMPCNIFLDKLFLIACFAISLFGIYLIGESAKKGYGLLTVLFSFITPYTLDNFFKFENEAPGFALIFLGMGLFLLWHNSKEKLKEIWKLGISLFLLCLGTAIWGGGIYYIISLFLYEAPLILISWPMLLIFLNQITENLKPASNIGESNPLISIVIIFFYVAWWKLREIIKNPFKSGLPYSGFLALFVIFGLFRPKFLILALPFLGLSMAKIWDGFNERGKKGFVILGIFLTLLFSIYLLPIDYLSFTPKASEHLAVKNLIGEAHDLNEISFADWQYAHMIHYYGGEATLIKTPEDINRSKQENFLVLTNFPMDCNLLSSYNTSITNELLGFWPRIYQCP